MNHDFGVARLEIEAGVATFTMDNPPRRNAMGPTMVNALRRAMDIVVEPSAGVRCLLLTGEGKVFCSGGDMAESRDIADAWDAGDSAAGSHYSLEMHHHPVIRRLRDLPFPFLTAVNGAAIGMGMSYALLGDLIFASRSAYFSARFVKVGMSPDAGMSWMLPRSIGNARAREMLMLGGKVSADEALSWGLINRVYDDEVFRQETRDFARTLAQGPTLALREIRHLSWQSWRATHDEQMAAEEAYQMALGRSEDAREGFTAFLEKRDPRFTGG
jgi:2-(1,2-epoxy-1,2-dihydrophenyl)acetyl-CoA isomerase